MMEVQDIVESSPEGTQHLFSDNPLENGFYLEAISYEEGKDRGRG